MAGEAFALLGDLTAPEERLVEATARGEMRVFDRDAPEAERLIRAACPALDAVGLKLDGHLRLGNWPETREPLRPTHCTGAVWLDRARIEAP